MNLERKELNKKGRRGEPLLRERPNNPWEDDHQAIDLSSRRLSNVLSTV